MKIAIMQPYFFPYIGYFQLINTVDKFVIYDDVNFIKKGWINRNFIFLSGEAHRFTIPLIQASHNRLISEIKVCDETNWRGKFLKKIELAYKKTPYFDEVFELVKSVVLLSEDYVSKLALKSLKKCSNYLGIETDFVDSSTIYNNKQLKGSQRLMDICLKEKAGEYINPPGGIELYSKRSFEESGIKLLFLRPKEIRYMQFGDDFIPNLSIIDVLMFNGKKELQKLLNDYEVV
jgi:hypothetical protein